MFEKYQFNNTTLYKYYKKYEWDCCMLLTKLLLLVYGLFFDCGKTKVRIQFKYVLLLGKIFKIKKKDL